MSFSYFFIHMWICRQIGNSHLDFGAIVGASRPLPGETTDQYNARQDWADEDCTKIFRIFSFHLDYKKISENHDVPQIVPFWYWTFIHSLT